VSHLGVLPAWARWSPAAAITPWSIGIEEEVMLLGADDLNLASRVDDVLAAAGPDLVEQLSQETHGSVVELCTWPHDDVPGAVAQLETLRAALKQTLEPLGLAAAAAGTHPCATWHDVHVSAGARQQELLGSMRELARREPTFALHVHVGVPEAELAVRVMNRMRAHVPLLLALSANSPFWQGRDSGLASARTPLFQAFPRAGLPRAFAGYEDLVDATDVLIRSGAVREPSFIWWDLRLQPRYGTLEVRVMDAQSSLDRTAGLATLVRALVRLEAEDEGHASPVLVDSPEVLAENRFLALRDGIEARFVDPDRRTLVDVREVLAGVLEACGPVEGIATLLEDPGPARQRAAAEGPSGLTSLMHDLVGQF